MIRLICYMPLLIPFLFAFSLFHPADPVHNMLKDLFEVEVKLNLFTFCFAIAKMGAVFLNIGIVVNFVCLALLSVYLAGYWLRVALPTGISEHNHKLKTYNFQTDGIGNVSEDSLIWLYRSLQCTYTISDHIFCNTRIALHSTALVIVAVVTSFSLVRYHDILLDGSALGISFFFVLSFGLVLALTIYSLECFFTGDLEDTWTNFKRSILKRTNRNSSVHKTAKSFRPISLKTGGPYFNVNRSTFLEWCDQIFESLVELLVTFA